jgi:hypothetical protein
MPLRRVAHDHRPGERFTWRERIIATAVVAGLVMPFLPVPGDGTARMKVHYRNDGAAAPAKFATTAPISVCQLLAYSLVYEHPETGTYTRVDCEQPDLQKP